MPFAPRPDIPGKICKSCGVPLTRKRYKNSLECYDRYLAREHCSQSCANSRAEVAEDTYHWRARQQRKDACEDCGATVGLHAHHKDRNPSNNDPRNLRTLCASCHLKLHWREDREKRLAVNPMVRAAKALAPKPCAICGGGFRPRHRRIQTCSPECKSVLLSRRLTEYFARQRAA